MANECNPICKIAKYMYTINKSVMASSTPAVLHDPSRNVKQLINNNKINIDRQRRY